MKEKGKKKETNAENKFIFQVAITVTGVSIHIKGDANFQLNNPVYVVFVVAIVT